MKVLVLGLVLLTLNSIVPSFALRCLECFGAKDDADCSAKGQIRQCRFNQDACEIELREHEGWGGGILMYKQCKQSRACDNNHVQNPRSAWMPSQCNPENFNSVCRCCCYDDLCNVARDNCFGRPGCGRMPESIHRGSISCTDGNELGSSCTVTCNSNAQLVGTATTYCRFDGGWSYPLAQCRDIQCSPRYDLPNGWFTCSNSFFSGSICSSQCRPGFKLSGPVRASCLNTGFWSSRLPQCVPLQCPDRGTVQGGVVTCSDERNVESRCKVVCEGFRRLTGITDSYCQDNGQWSHPLPTCDVIQCPIRGSIVHGSVSCSLGVEVNSACIATCDEGYGPDSAINSICLPTGNWDSPLPRCIRIQCPERGSVVNGDVSCTNSVYAGSVCTAVCDEGSRLIGEEVSECLPTGEWSVPLPVCERVQCPERGTIENGVVSCHNKRYVGSRCTAECNVGTQLIGIPSSICLPIGEWSTPLPSCPRITCPSLDFSSQAGTMSCTDEFYYASTCSFTCDGGLRVVGAPRISCRRNGFWTTRMPTCEPILCNQRGRIPNGVVSCSNDRQINSVCEATCNSGYSLFGPNPSVCLPSGKWDTRLPTCRAIICPIRGTIVGGTVTCTNDNNYGSICRSSCGPDAELIGSAQSTCLATGRWDTALPTCRRLPCSAQSSIDHGSVTCTDEWNIRSVCTFTCDDPGYELYPKGRSRNVCQPSQRWNLPAPCCTRPCPPYALMDIVMVLDSSSSIGSENWIMLTDFVRGIIRTFIVAEDAANFAIFRYNRDVDTTTQIFLNSYRNDIEGLIDAFGRIPYDGSGTFTGGGLRHALAVSLAVENGNRPGVKDVVFVITDGKAADDVKTPADDLRAAGASILVLGIEPPRGVLDLGQLNDIAGSPSNLVIAAGGFAGLDAEFGIKLSRTICGKPCE